VDGAAPNAPSLKNFYPRGLASELNVPLRRRSKVFPRPGPPQVVGASSSLGGLHPTNKENEMAKMSRKCPGCRQQITIDTKSQDAVLCAQCNTRTYVNDFLNYDYSENEMAKMSRKCPYCETKVTLDDEESAVNCGHCGEHIPRVKFPVREGGLPPIDYELENARSLRAIAVSLLVIAENDTLEREWDVDEFIEVLRGVKVGPFE